MNGDVPIADRPPAPFAVALVRVVHCVVTVIGLLARHEIRQPVDHRDVVLQFRDGTHGRVYRETFMPEASRDAPALLVVAFRLRWVHGWGHPLFRAESLLNTILFAGFPGLVSKLWCAHDEHEVYRGFYEWNDADLADRYARALWWVLALVSVRDSIHYVVVPGLRRDEVLADPTVLDTVPVEGDWWRLVEAQPS